MSSKKSPLLIIFLTVFLDMLGVTIIIPVIPALFFEPGSSIFPPGFPVESRSILYGLLLASYPVMQFFGAPVLGGLSDRKGRKPVLTFSMIGSLVGYLVFGYAILSKNIWLLFLARMLPGFMGGNIAIILSAIADVSSKESKARNFGLVGAAFGLGFILGPTIGGILADNTVVSWFSSDVPFWGTAALTSLNLILIQFIFPETLKKPQSTPLTLFRGVRNIRRSFQAPDLRKAFSVVLLLSLGFAFFTQFFSVYLIREFSFTEKNIGMLYGWVGIWLVLTQGLIVRRLSKFYGPQQLLPISIPLLSLALICLLIPDQAVWLYVVNPFIAIFQGITTPNMTAFVSQQVNDEQQGEILGINQSMSALGQAIPPLIGGALQAFSPAYPLVAAAGLTFVGFLLFRRVGKSSR